MLAGSHQQIAAPSQPMRLTGNLLWQEIKAGQRAGFGERYFSVDFGDTDHAAVARAFGIPAHRVADPERLEGVLREALAAAGPCLVDVVCQPLQDARAPVSEWIT